MRHLQQNIFCLALSRGVTVCRILGGNAAFTLLEVIITLVLLGMLGVGAVGYFGGVLDSAKDKSLEIAVQDAQGRINSQYSQAVLIGESCKEATKGVDTLEKISDDGTTRFGIYEFKLDGSGTIRTNGSTVHFKDIEGGSEFADTGMKLYLPNCAEYKTNIFFPEFGGMSIDEWLENGYAHSAGTSEKDRTETVDGITTVWSGWNGDERNTMQLTYKDEISDKTFLYIEFYYYNKTVIDENGKEYQEKCIYIHELRIDGQKYIGGGAQSFDSAKLKDALEKAHLSTEPFNNIFDSYEDGQQIPADAQVTYGLQ